MSIKKHDKATAEAIFNMIGWPESVVIRDDGVYLNEDFRTYSPRDSVFDWTESTRVS